MRSLEGGGWKSTSNGNSLATYPTAQHPNLAEAMRLSTSFGQLVRQRQPEQLDSCLAQANCSNLSPFRLVRTPAFRE